ncbi:MAG: phosphoenolpyruvate synthase, partial [Planctomycetota bacterium]
GKKPIIEKSLGSKEKKLIYNRKNPHHPVINVDTTPAERESFVLTEEGILKLARWGCAIEKHYQRPMDIEWAKEDQTGEIYIIQARPETVQSHIKNSSLKSYRLLEKGTPLVTGISIGEAISTGRVCNIKSPKEIDKVKPNSILVTEMTDPDWVPIMQKVVGIVTAHGGRTCHAAIISRELGVPAIVGAKDATTLLKEGQEITLSCAEGVHGNVYPGTLKYEVTEYDIRSIPATTTSIMLNVGNPETAFQWWKLPCDGIGLARMEFIIDQEIQIHPMALVRFDTLTDPEVRKKIEERTRGYLKKTDYFVDHLAHGIAQIGASQYPKPVIVRMSDFKTNEYANLIGGQTFEPHEENPMIGFRGASRYYHERYREGFDLECRAIKKVREEIGLDNVVMMIPFCRTLEEADQVLKVLAENGLKRGENHLEVYVMCEIPSNVILAEGFSDRFDGFSIGSNDLTQLVLGVDRDSAMLAELFDERNEAVKQMIRMVIKSAHQKGRKVGICGQAPSDHPDFAQFLVEAGIDSISLNPDSFVKVKSHLAKLSKKSVAPENASGHSKMQALL